MDETQEKNMEKPVLLLTSYADFIIKENSNKWRNMEGFITCGKQTYTGRASSQLSQSPRRRRRHSRRREAPPP
jgi:hypothetical protein